MSENDLNQQTFNQKVKTSLDNSVDMLDSDTRQQLANRRKLALNSRSEKTGWLSQHWRAYFMPVGALAFCGLLAIAIVINPQTAQDSIDIASNNAENPAAVLEVLNNAEDLDVISDPDFYAWAEETLSNDKASHQQEPADAV